jgi:hypothetical protein
MRGGLLSALLSLYNADQGLPSGMMTPGSAGGSIRGNTDSWDRPSNVSTTGYSTPETATPRSGAQTPTKKFSTLFGQRPPVERNAAGVIGSLIASTGNIAGPAAPKNSQLGPNLKRPGYHLSR